MIISNCKHQLIQLFVDDGPIILSWKCNSADNYEVIINGEIFSTQEKFLEIVRTDLLEGENQFIIKAISLSSNIVNSELSFIKNKAAKSQNIEIVNGKLHYNNNEYSGTLLQGQNYLKLQTSEFSSLKSDIVEYDVYKLHSIPFINYSASKNTEEHYYQYNLQWNNLSEYDYFYIKSYVDYYLGYAPSYQETIKIENIYKIQNTFYYSLKYYLVATENAYQSVMLI